MMETSNPVLKWTSQYSVSPAAKTTILKGDKIILPPSALEQLLSAATTIVATPADVANPRTSNFDPFNPYSFEAERHARTEIIERRQELPHPLTFRLVNPKNGRVVFAGIREFSAGDDEVGLSPFLRHSLGIEDVTWEKTNGSLEDSAQYSEGVKSEQKQMLTVHFQQLPKGTYVRLRPLEAGYDPEDWKALLENYLRENFTTLTNGEILAVPAGKEEFRFLVDELKPNNDAISLVDTDLEVDIEALNEEQARETLKQRVRKSQKTPGTSEGSSAGGKIELGSDEFGKVRSGEYVDYTVENWDPTKAIELELSALDDERDVDLFVTPTGAKQRARPREDEHVFGDLSVRPTKRIKIQHTYSELENTEALWISVRGYGSPSGEPDVPADDRPIQYHLRVTLIEDQSISNGQDVDMEDDSPSNPDGERCKNCRQWVPFRTMILHENFCFRNNILCPNCKKVFKKSPPEWQHHWHCPHDNSYGDTQNSHQKHDYLLHTPRPCPNCSYHASNTLDLAQHRTTTCPGRQILCQFCHLQVPQQGNDDPPFSDPEVILSGLTPHELVDGARTTECHLCAKIVRLRDMSTHLRHHNLQRLSRSTPRICRNANCGRTLEGVDKNGDIKRDQPLRNELGVCDTCFGPLYVSMYDPEGKALKRRVERKYLTQLLTGCGQMWCRNEYCKTGRKHLGMERAAEAVTSKEALRMIKPFLEGLREGKGPVHFCTDEGSQRRRGLAEMIVAEGGDYGGLGKGKGKGKGRESNEGDNAYDINWCVAALEAEGGDLNRARDWLRNWAPTRGETSR